MDRNDLPQPNQTENKPMPVYYREYEIDFVKIIKALIKNWKPALAVFSLFVAAGIVYLLLAKPVYTTDFLVKLPSVPSYGGKEITLATPQETEMLVKNLQELIDEERYDKLAKLLNVSEETALTVHSILPKVLKNNPSVIKIVLEVYEPEKIPLLTDRLVDYLNSNRFVQERISLKKKEILSLLAEMESRLEEIKKIKNQVLEKIERGEIKNLGFNPVEMSQNIINLQKQITALNNQLKLLRGYETAVEPIIPEEPDKPNKIIVMGISTLLGITAGLFTALILEWYRSGRKEET